MKHVRVCSLQPGWQVEADILSRPNVYLSGASAERAAHRLAQMFLSVGDMVTVEIRDRAGVVVQSQVLGPGGLRRS